MPADLFTFVVPGGQTLYVRFPRVPSGTDVTFVAFLLGTGLSFGAVRVIGEADQGSIRKHSVTVDEEVWIRDLRLYLVQIIIILTIIFYAKYRNKIRRPQDRRNLDPTLERFL